MTIDHKIVHDGEQIINNFTLITTSAWITYITTSGGVNLLINRNLKKSLAGITAINKRILQINFNGNPKATLIINYSPT